MAISETKGQGWKSTRLLVWAYSQSGLFSRTPGTRKVKPLWILMKQDMMGWQWIQLDHMQIICTSLQTDNPIFYRLFSSSKHVPGSVNYKFKDLIKPFQAKLYIYICVCAIRDRSLSRSLHKCAHILKCTTYWCVFSCCLRFGLSVSTTFKDPS